MKHISLRVPDALLARIQAEADQQHRSVNSQVIVFCERGLDEADRDTDR